MLTSPTTETLIVADLHLGIPASRPGDLQALLEHWKFERLILLGDIFHDYAVHRFGGEAWQLLRHLRALAGDPAVEVVWLKGNHDRHLAGIAADFTGIRMRESFRWSSGGRRYLALHGDRFDAFVTNNRRVSRALSHAYGFCQRRLSRHGRWPCALDRMHGRLSGIGEHVATRAARFARRRAADVIVCGHTHEPIHRRFPCLPTVRPWTTGTPAPGSPARPRSWPSTRMAFASSAATETARRGVPMMARSLVREAAASHDPATARGLLERLFARLFEGPVYPQIWEDPVVDAEALAIGPGMRLAAIASGGCNVMSYLAAAPAEIVAVDLNRHHVALLRLKLAAAQSAPGHESYFRFFGRADDPGNVRLYDRWLARSLDPATRAYWDERLWGRRRIEAFGRGFYRTGLLGRTIGAAHLVARLHGRAPAQMLDSFTPRQQVEVFEATLDPLFDSPLVRVLFRLPLAWFGLGIPPAQLDALKAECGGDLAWLARQRVRRLACDFPIQDNYFAAQAFGRGYDPHGGAVPPYLEARHFAAVRTHSARVDVRQASMTETLAAREVSSLDGYVLLDAQDWMTPAQLAALWAQIDRTAAPGARVIFRTAGEPSPLEPVLPPSLLDNWCYEVGRSRAFHARDRSAIYGGFHLYRRRRP